MNSLASMINSLEIEFDVNSIKTVKFPKSENGLTRPSLAIFVGELD